MSRLFDVLEVSTVSGVSVCFGSSTHPQMVPKCSQDEELPLETVFYVVTATKYIKIQLDVVPT